MFKCLVSVDYMQRRLPLRQRGCCCQQCGILIKLASKAALVVTEMFACNEHPALVAIPGIE